MVFLGAGFGMLKFVRPKTELVPDLDLLLLEAPSLHDLIQLSYHERLNAI